MADIPAPLVHKLTHRLAEIRQRALLSIASKLENGQSCDLARTRQLLFNLFHWFLLEPCTHEEQVLHLIGRVLQSAAGRTLTAHIGNGSIRQELQTIRSYIQPEYHGKIDKIVADLGPQNAEVPPLCPEVPLSFRSDAAGDGLPCLPDVYTTASTIKGLVQKEGSLEPQTGFQASPSSDAPTYRIGEEGGLQWQPLIDTDQSVLRSIEEVLKRPESASQLFHSCEFFSDVLLRDFPAEVFLQRPRIVIALLDLLTSCSSRRLSGTLLRCLSDLTRALQVRLNHSNDYCLRTLKVPLSLEPMVAACDSESHSKDQLSIADYCSRGTTAVLDCLKHGKLNQTGLNSCLVMLNELLNLMGLSGHHDPRKIDTSLDLLGDTLEYFRLECSSLEGDRQSRAVYLYLLCTAAKFLKPTADARPLARSLKLALTNSLLDVGLGRLYPAVHQALLQCVQGFSSTDDLKRYEHVKRIGAGLSATVQLLHDPLLSVPQKFRLAKQALPSVELHKSAQFLEAFVDLCSSADQASDEASEAVLQLLAHRSSEVRERMYALSHQKVMECVGAHLPQNPGRVSFLLDAEILTEIALFGLASPEVGRYAEEMLLYLLKCRVLVEPQVWSRCAQALVPTLPVLLCYGDNSSALGRSVVDLVDPDTAHRLGLPEASMLAGNVQLLFSKDPGLREEALSRLCWLMARQEDARDLLPKFSSIHDRALSSACVQSAVLDVNKMRHSQHFYQPSSLEQVLELLEAADVEPVLRRSALNQVSVMMEDHLLHQVFLDKGGVALLVALMRRALTDSDYRDYPDSAIAIVATLRTLALYHSSVRDTLATQPQVLFHVLRGLFLFVTDDRMRQDAAILLFLLAFRSFVSGSPARGDLAIPALAGDRLLVPFLAATGWRCSRHVSEDLLSDILQDRWSLSSLQVLWHSEARGGFDSLLAMDAEDVQGPSELLTLRAADVAQLQLSSTQHQVHKGLLELHEVSAHQEVQACLHQLSLYLHLNAIASSLGQAEDLLAQPWEQALGRYLETPPSSDEDVELLDTVIQLVIVLVPLYKEAEHCWVAELLQRPSHTLFDLLDTDEKPLRSGLLQLVTVCVMREHRYLDGVVDALKWGPVVALVGDQLRLSSAQHFYNLAYLDALLSCLVHLTASLGWSAQRPPGLLNNLVASLCELLRAFHCGKGPSAAASLMGLSISRHALLILNHLAAEMQRSRYKGWERCFLDQDHISSFVAMWGSRDVVLRAAALQLFASLTQSPKAADEICQDGELCELALQTVTDHSEAGVVRENAALLLANMGGHRPQETRRALGRHGLLRHLDVVFTALFTLEGAPPREPHVNVSTPGLVRALCMLLDHVADAELSAQLLDLGLVKLIFRTLCLPALAVDTKRELALYCDILEMDAAVCRLLLHLCSRHGACRGTVLHTKDCLAVLFGLLNSQSCDTHLAQLAYLRNRLWSEVFHLVAALAGGDDRDASIIVQTVQDTGVAQFLDAACQALDNMGVPELQNAALSALVALGQSLAALLDTVRSPSTVRVYSQSQTPRVDSANPLEEAYFGKVIQRPQLDVCDDEETMAGAELCKILLFLYEVIRIQQPPEAIKKPLAMAALTVLLGVSQQAKNYALRHGLIQTVVKELRELHIRLSLEPVERVRRAQDRKRVWPSLQAVGDLLGLLTNLLVDSEQAKALATGLGLADVVHKLWVWLALHGVYMAEALRLLVVYTLDCPAACRSLPMTSAVAGAGPRKTPSNASLLNCLVALVVKEMDLVSRTHDLLVLELALDVLRHCCAVLECRAVLSKSILFQAVARLHPAVSRKQPPWERVELLWLDFLEAFTRFPEGQSTVAKVPEVLELVTALAGGGKGAARHAALLVLRNVAFYLPNRPRLLSSSDFLNVLQLKLSHGTSEERRLAALMMWSLAANNQRAKLVFKAAKLDVKLENVVRSARLLVGSAPMHADDLEILDCVLDLLR